MPSIDRLDAHIIRQLSANARTGVVELATILGVTRTTVQSRLKRLEETGVITGFRPKVDLSTLGVTVEAFAALALEQGRLDSVVEELKKMPQVLEVHTMTGREDLLVRLASTSNAELQKLVQRVLSLPGVAHSNTTLALTTPLPYRVQPLLDHLTEEAGWGRSTALPT